MDRPETFSSETPPPNINVTAPPSSFPLDSTSGPESYYGNYSSLYVHLRDEIIIPLELAVFYCKIGMVTQSLDIFKSLYLNEAMQGLAIDCVDNGDDEDDAETRIKSLLAHLVISLEHAHALIDLHRDFKAAVKVLDKAGSKINAGFIVKGEWVMSEHRDLLAGLTELEKLVGVMRAALEFHMTCKLDKGLQEMISIREWLKALEVEKYSDVQVGLPLIVSLRVYYVFRSQC